MALRQQETGVEEQRNDVLRAQEPWLRRWVAAGVSRSLAFDAFELVTAFVVGFVIEEQERERSGPSRYSAEERDERLGSGAPPVAEAGHARRDSAARYRRQLLTAIAGIQAQES